MINEDILLGVRKPGRYIGEEWNVSRKDFTKAAIKFAICFPDMYEVGMSNLGLRIIYSLLNKKEEVVCERFFAPDIDMEKALRDNKRPLFSLESKKGLREFDLIGFSLGYELGYTNALNMLELGAIPLRAEERDISFPLVMAGGPAVLNPEPLHEFFDLFVLGEAEEVILEIVAIYQEFKSRPDSANLSKKDLLFRLAQIEGVYVPSFYEPEYNAQGKISEFRAKLEGLPLKIKKRIVRDLDSVYFPAHWLVPHIQIVHDRITLEIMRGCVNRCRFCQARAQYFPWRQRSVKKILHLADEMYRNSGYEEISLAGLSVSDYPRLKELLEPLVAGLRDKGISISLPSIKPNDSLGELADLIATIKKTALTFAPEAATDRLRRIIGKDFNEADFFKTLKESYQAGYQRVKLYFMIGLPGEEAGDLDAILEFAKNVAQARREITGRPAQVNISINTLIPKPHTPLQWLGMMGLEEIKNKQDYLKAKIKNRNLKVTFHNRFMSFLEGVFSRGDRRLSRVLLAAFIKGARFDGWDEHFRFDIWTEAFKECKIDPDAYLRERAVSEILPWDCLDVGIGQEELAREFNKTIAIK
jgi:radical SAM family uncharacterized protein